MANVYAIGFPSGKLYVGLTSKTVAQRLTAHLKDTRAGSKLPIHNALRKYGRNVRLIILVQDVFFDEAKDLEIWWISELATMAPNGYNLTAGGDGSVGYMPTAETLKRLSESHKGLPGNRTGKKLTEEQKKRLSEAHKGKKFSVERRAKMSEAMKRSPIVAANIKKVSEGNRGKKHSAERKAKLSEVIKRWWSVRNKNA